MMEESCLSHGTTVAILLRLLESDGKAIMKDLSDIVSNYQTRQLRTAEMEEQGLIDIVTTYTPQKYTNIMLSEKGRSIATSISTIDLFISPHKNYLDKGICRKYGETILRLMSNGNTFKLTDILREIPNPGSVNKTLAALEEDGLLTIRMSESGYRSKIIQLTDLGVRCGKVFIMVHGLMRK